VVVENPEMAVSPAEPAITPLGKKMVRVVVPAVVRVPVRALPSVVALVTGMF